MLNITLFSFVLFLATQTRGYIFRKTALHLMREKEYRSTSAVHIWPLMKKLLIAFIYHSFVTLKASVFWHSLAFHRSSWDGTYFKKLPLKTHLINECDQISPHLDYFVVFPATVASATCCLPWILLSLHMQDTWYKKMNTTGFHHCRERSILSRSMLCTPSKKPTYSTYLGHQTGTLETQNLALHRQGTSCKWNEFISELHNFFVFHNSAFISLKKFVQRTLWARYYTTIPQRKWESVLQLLGCRNSTLSKAQRCISLCCVTLKSYQTLFLHYKPLREWQDIFSPPSYFSSKCQQCYCTTWLLVTWGDTAETKTAEEASPLQPCLCDCFYLVWHAGDNRQS